jgi:hypothetical protein
MLSDPRFHARAVVNRQVHAIQQESRDNNAPFGFYGGATKRKRAPRNTSVYKLRGSNTARITQETTALRNEMPPRGVIRNRLVAAFRARGLEQVPYELIDISTEIINSLTQKKNKLIDDAFQPRFATEYFPTAPRKPRTRKPVITIDQLQQQVEDSINRATTKANARARPVSTTRAAKARERMTPELKEKMRLGRKRAMMQRRGIINRPQMLSLID